MIKWVNSFEFLSWKELISNFASSLPSRLYFSHLIREAFSDQQLNNILPSLWHSIPLSDSFFHNSSPHCILYVCLSLSLFVLGCKLLDLLHSRGSTIVYWMNKKSLKNFEQGNNLYYVIFLLVKVRISLSYQNKLAERTCRWGLFYKRITGQIVGQISNSLSKVCQ